MGIHPRWIAKPKPVPPKSHRLTTDLDRPLLEEVLYIVEEKWEPDVEHHRQADVLGARLEGPKRGAFALPDSLPGAPVASSKSPLTTPIREIKPAQA